MKNLFNKFFECFRVQWPVAIVSISGILSVCCLTACFQVKAGKAVQYRNISEDFHITYQPSTSYDVFMWLTFQLILLWACFTKSSKSTLHSWCDHNCFSRAKSAVCSKQCNETSNRPQWSHKWNYVQDHWWKLCPKMCWLFLRSISERWTFDKILWECYWKVSAFAFISNHTNIFSVTNCIIVSSRHPNLVSNIEEVIDDGVSLMAMNSNDDIIGIRLSCIVTK